MDTIDDTMVKPLRQRRNIRRRWTGLIRTYGEGKMIKCGRCSSYDLTEDIKRTSLAFDTIVCMYSSKILLWYHPYLLYVALYIVFTVSISILGFCCTVDKLGKSHFFVRHEKHGFLMLLLNNIKYFRKLKFTSNEKINR